MDAKESLVSLTLFIFFVTRHKTVEDENQFSGPLVAVFAPVRSASSAWLLVRRQGLKRERRKKKKKETVARSARLVAEWRGIPKQRLIMELVDLSKPKHQKSTARSTAKRVLDIPRPTATNARLIITRCSVVKFELRLKTNPICTGKVQRPRQQRGPIYGFSNSSKIQPKRKSQKRFSFPQVDQNLPWFRLIRVGRGDGDVMGSNLASNLHIPRSRSHYLHTGAS